MRNTALPLLKAHLLLMFILIAPAQEESAAKAKLDAVAKSSARGDIERIDVLRLPKSYRSFVAVRPEEMEKDWFYRMTFRELRPPKEKLIAEALNLARITRSDREWDLRWAIVFYSRSGQRRIAALYFDETGRHGSVDRTPVSYAPEFFNRLKSALGLSIE
jgi:hypothetical protein